MFVSYILTRLGEENVKVQDKQDLVNRNESTEMINKNIANQTLGEGSQRKADETRREMTLSHNYEEIQHKLKTCKM